MSTAQSAWDAENDTDIIDVDLVVVEEGGGTRQHADGI